MITAQEQARMVEAFGAVKVIQEQMDHSPATAQQALSDAAAAVSGPWEARHPLVWRELWDRDYTAYRQEQDGALERVMAERNELARDLEDAHADRADLAARLTAALNERDHLVHQVHELSVELDDVLDIASEHALDIEHERLVVSQVSRYCDPAPRRVGAVLQA